MNLIQQPNNWSCSAASLAMLLDKSLEEIYQTVGHNGSEIIFPHEERESVRRRGFATEEIIDVAYHYGVALTRILACPVIQDSQEKIEKLVFPNYEERLQAYMLKGAGLLVGEYAPNRLHMCAWDGVSVYDPLGRIYTFEDSGEQLTIDYFLLASRII